jgi:hypothetical protein
MSTLPRRYRPVYHEDGLFRLFEYAATHKHSSQWLQALPAILLRKIREGR